MPNVSVRILNPDPKTLPSASCATAPGADPGSVLSDANGDATCYPVFGPIAGNSPVSVLVGGLDPAQFDQTISPQPLTEPLAYDQYVGIQLAVTPVTPGRRHDRQRQQSEHQSGPTSSAPLVVQVTDATGAVDHRQHGCRLDGISRRRGHTEPDRPLRPIRRARRKPPSPSLPPQSDRSP